MCRQLKYLTLTNCELTALPAVVCGMSRLLLLKLNINKIQVRGEGEGTEAERPCQQAQESGDRRTGGVYCAAQRPSL